MRAVIRSSCYELETVRFKCLSNWIICWQTIRKKKITNNFLNKNLKLEAEIQQKENQQIRYFIILFVDLLLTAHLFDAPPNINSNDVSEHSANSAFLFDAPLCSVFFLPKYYVFRLLVMFVFLVVKLYILSRASNKKKPSVL